MALHTKKQLSVLCNMAGSNEVSVYVSRRKLIMSGDYIDDQIPQNKEFIQKRLSRTPPPSDLKVNSPEEVTYPVPNTKKAKAAKPTEQSSDDGIWGLEKQQKALAIEKIKKENELLDVKIAKAHGDSVPTDLVKPLFAQHSKSMSAAFYNAADNLLARFVKKYKVTPADMAAYRGELIDIINRATIDSIEDSRAGLKTIVNEYSEKRGVGEKI